MNPQQRNRYSRQIKLPSVGEGGQQAFLDARVFIVGMGGLGSPLALYLAAAGVGHLVISDFDQVEESNLQRQIIHTQNRVGELKVDSAKAGILAINPECEVTTLAYELDETELIEQCEGADVIVDCTDNFPSRFGLNQLSLNTQTPLVSGAAIRQEGQISTFDPNVANSPCYQCVYTDEGLESATCAMEGVMAPVVGIIGTLQAQEVLNVLLNKPALVGRLLLLDAANIEWQSVKLSKNPHCKVCG
ncbi:MAG: molybdopterin/thiamine biosynthesis adenylyltransferase [Saprospiraceae bacterium]|jgi:molybdopterin/thiamine biosynthesis adenylyltransferase